MEIRLSEPFEKDYLTIKDAGLRERVYKAILKLADDPQAGKPLRYAYKGNRRLRVDPFRIMYRIEGDVIRVTCFEHRGKAYK